MSSLIPFSFESREIRFIPEGDSFSVVAKDVLQALGFSESSLANIPDRISHVPDEWKGRHPIATLGGTQEMWCFTEQGLYFFVNRSDKPKALPLQKWVAGDVLPSIRKTGSYSLPDASPQNAVLAAQLAELLKDKVLVDYEDLRIFAGGVWAAHHALGSLQALIKDLEKQCGRPLVAGLETLKPSPGPSPNPPPVPRPPLHPMDTFDQMVARVLDTNTQATVTTGDIANALWGRPPTRAEETRIGRAVGRLGWNRIRVLAQGRRQYHYERDLS